MSGSTRRNKLMPMRYRTKPIKKWLPNEEIALINYLKKHRSFEKPVARVYYSKFLQENDIKGVDWKIVRSKVRNMRIRYRAAKECEIKKAECNDSEFNAEDIRKETLKTCWYVDAFDDIFPNEMDGYIYKHPQADIFFNQESSSKQNLYEDTLSDHEPSLKINNSKQIPAENLFPEDDFSSSSSSSNSVNGDILTMQEDIFNIKTQKRNKDTNIRQQEIDLLKEKLNFEKEKFRQEFALKEREIESQERIKIMELQMKERIAMKELELKERLALKSMEKRETSAFNNVYHNMA